MLLEGSLEGVGFGLLDDEAEFAEVDEPGEGDGGLRFGGVEEVEGGFDALVAGGGVVAQGGFDVTWPKMLLEAMTCSAVSGSGPVVLRS